MKPFRFWSVILTGIIAPFANAQEFNISMQLRPRYEYRHGYKDFLQDHQNPASFISQRSRLNFHLKNDTWQVYLSLHNNPVWGENDMAAAENKSTFTVFEAWANYQFHPKMSLKIGRQTLVYDNQRILGALDWTQQGLYHDAVVLQYQNKNTTVHGGYALNNASENLEKKPYTVNNYKNMQYVWMQTNATDLAISLLILNAGYETAIATDRFKTEYHQTLGTFLNYHTEKWIISSAVYAQTGKLNLQKKEAYNALATAQYHWTDRLKSTIGYEYLSGTNQGKPSNVNRSFAPLYGTNHSFNGAMDYFNNGTFQNSVGLHDLYLNGKIQFSKWNLEAAPHVFYADKDIFNTNNEKMSALLGTELDLMATYQVEKDLKITAGYSQLFATNSFETLKKSPKNTQNQWAWLMVTFEPILFTVKK